MRPPASVEAGAIDLSIVIPCFNEQEVLPQLFSRVTNAAVALGCSWEVICVDDGSRDDTWPMLRGQSQVDARWRAISFARNFGHQIALSAGLSFARGDAVAVLDADLQDPPEVLASFLEKWRVGYEVVYAIREKRKENALKRACYWGFYRLLARLVPFPLPVDSGDFCLMDRRVVSVLNAMPERARFVRGLRAWAGFKQIGVPYERASRVAGQPKYTMAKLMKLAWDGVFSFSAVPLRLASHLGLWVSLLALAGILFTFCQRVLRAYFTSIGLGPTPGFATIVISILFLGGVQLISLGILGEYLGRIYDEVKGRPLWIIKDSVGLEAPQTPYADRGRRN